MELRPAEIGDYEGIAALVTSEEELFRVYPAGEYPFSVAQIRELARVRKDLTVASDDGRVIGFANLYDVRPGQWAFIGNVVVARNVRGKGAGRALVAHMATLAFDRYALSEVRISVFSQNTPALLLYAGMGFRPFEVEERRDPGGHRVALIHMALGRQSQSRRSGAGNDERWHGA